MTSSGVVDDRRRPRAPRPPARAPRRWRRRRASAIASRRRWLTARAPDPARGWYGALPCRRARTRSPGRSSDEPHLGRVRLRVGDRPAPAAGVSANVTGTTCAGILLPARARCRRPSGAAAPTSMMRAPGTTTRDCGALRSSRREGGDDVDELSPGPILPATPVSASTRIASSRWPGREVGRRHEHALAAAASPWLEVRAGDEADELARVAQRGRRRPALPASRRVGPCRR